MRWWPLCVLKYWLCVCEELYNSTLLWWLVVFWTFVIVLQPDLFLTGSCCWRCIKTFLYCKGKDLTLYLALGYLKARYLGNKFWSMQIYSPVDHIHKPCWPSHQEIWRWPLGSVSVNQTSRQMYKLLYGRYQWAQGGQGSMQEWCLTFPKNACVLSRCVQTWSLSLKLNLQDK